MTITSSFLFLFKIKKHIHLKKKYNIIDVRLDKMKEATQAFPLFRLQMISSEGAYLAKL